MNEKRGIDQKNRQLVAAIVFGLLLFFEPFAPSGGVVWILYIAGIPSAVYLGLSYFGKYWKMDQAANLRVSRALFGIISGAFLMFSLQSFTVDQHYTCDQEARNRDEIECVGEYVLVDGADLGSGFIGLLFGSAAFWLAIKDK